MAEITSLRVAVFGISRSGKDYSIGKVTEALSDIGLNFVHYPCIPTVRDYSFPILNKEFKDTSPREKGRLMEIFRRKISDRENIPFLIQDEHCCFPATYGGKPLVNDYTKAKFPFEMMKDPDNSRVYEVVLKEEWISNCEMVFYLRPDPSVIKDRMLNSDGPKRNTQITTEDIDLWMKFEIELLSVMCARNKIHFEVLEGNNGAQGSIIDRIRNVNGILISAVPQPRSCKEEYTIVEKNREYAFASLRSNGVRTITGPYDDMRHVFFLQLGNLERTCRKDGERFDIDSMLEEHRFEFKEMFKAIKNTAKGIGFEGSLSELSLINERIIGDSLNSIPVPHRLEGMFKISPLVGIICLGKSSKILVEELNSKHSSLRYNNYPDLLMRMRRKGFLSRENYNLLQSLEDHRRHYATNIYANAPDPSQLARWRKLYSELIADVFCFEKIGRRNKETEKLTVICANRRTSRHRKGGEKKCQDHQMTKGQMQ
ncbi:MAG: hypothetical protein FWD37_04670 [Methanomassiliicoccaceae archaeon]|nr:hypothetical protein [Methanomassiliicoccaceae archaeon]